jgi:hypothetical protein
MSKCEHPESIRFDNLCRASSSQGDDMNSKISDVALDLGVFALDSEIENNAILYPIGGPAWNSSASWDRIDTECFAVAS